MLKKINYFINIIEIIVMVICFYLVKDINILPDKYFYLYIVINIVIFIGIFLSTFILKKKLFCFINTLCSILIITLFSFCIYYLNNTNKLLSTLGETIEKNYYYVIVKNDSKYDKLSKLKNKKLGIIKDKSINYEKVVSEINKEININIKDYDNISTMVNDLLEDEIDSILLSSSNKDILSENMVSFKEGTKYIYEFSIELIKEKEEEYKRKYGPFNILISGIDTAGSIDKVSRSDVNIIVTVNPNSNNVLLTSVPRDMQVQLHDTTGVKDKLTHAGIYGIDMSRKTLEDFLETEIPYYVRINFDGVVKIVDAIGGVDINNDVEFRGSTRYFNKGKIHLNGKQALEYARNRYNMPSGDWDRSRHQEEIIRAIIEKVSTSTELLTNYASFVDILNEFIQTNIPDDTIRKYVKDQLDSMPNWNVINFVVSGYGSGYEYTYSMPGVKLYVTYPHEESRILASKQINDTLSETNK